MYRSSFAPKLKKPVFDEGVGNNLEEMTYKPANSGNTKAGSGANKGTAMRIETILRHLTAKRRLRYDGEWEGLFH